MSDVSDKHRVLLINPCSPDPGPIYYGPPYGLSIIAAYLEKNGVIPECLDFDRKTQHVMENEVLDIIDGYHIIGISIQSSNRGGVYSLIKKIKSRNPSIVIVLGGPFASQMYELILENYPVDFCVVGEGHQTFYELIRAIKQTNKVSEVKGISYVKDGKVEFTGERDVEPNLDKLPFPGFNLFGIEGLLGKGIEEYYVHKNKRCLILPDALMLLSSIGCIYSCNFCPMSGVKKDKYREHSAKYFVDLIEHFVDFYGQRNFVFGDNFFTLHKDRTIEICRDIVRRGLNLNWVCMTRTDYVDLELLKEMKSAGCLEISFGVESCSPKVQKSIGKNLDLSSVKKAIDGCNTVGIRSVLMLMVGNTGETKKTIFETLSSIRELDPDDVQVKITKVYPGTKIHEIACDAGIINNLYYLKDETQSVSFTVEHSRDELVKLRDMIHLRTAYIEIGKTCNNNCNSCRFTGVDLSTEKVLRLLDKVQHRADEVTFCGGEVTIRKDFFTIIDYAKNLKLSKVNIRSNGRIFSYVSFTRKILAHNIDTIFIPLRTLDQAISFKETKVKSALDDSIRGIKNISKSDSGRLVVEVYPDPGNLIGSIDILKFLVEIGVERFNIIFESIGRKDDILGLTKEIEGLLFGKEFNFFNIPYCYANDPELVGDIFFPFDESYSTDGDVVNIGRKRRNSREKSSECNACEYNNLCEGFWK